MHTPPLDRLLQEACERGDVPGVVCCVTDSSGTVHQASYGSRDLSSRTPMPTDAVFWIASMTKAITSAAALQQVEQGHLSLHGPLGRVDPWLLAPPVLEGFDAAGQPRTRPASQAPTLHHLLTHTSGFGYEYWSSAVQQWRKARGVPSIASCRNAALELPLLFDPGQRWEYGIGIDWAGKVVEAHAQERLGPLLRRNLLGPLGMRDTGFAIDPAWRPRLARVHQRMADGSLGTIDMEVAQDPEFEMGGGGLYGTATDYARFARLILKQGLADGERLLAPQSIASMLTSQIDPLEVVPLRSAAPRAVNDLDFFPGVPQGFSYGFLVNRQVTQTGLSAGSVSWTGFANTYCWIDPVRGIAGIFLTQVVPCCDARALALYYAFQRAVCAAWDGRAVSVTTRH